jgi:predicted small metal-binding protein
MPSVVLYGMLRGDVGLACAVRVGDELGEVVDRTRNHTRPDNNSVRPTIWKIMGRGRGKIVWKLFWVYSEKRQEEKEAKRHARQFHQITKYFPRLPRPLLLLLLLFRRSTFNLSHHTRPGKVSRSRVSMSRRCQIAILEAQEQAGPSQISKR